MDDKIDAVRNVALDNQRNIATIQVKVENLDTNVDKLTDISLSVSKLLAVHEQRIDTAEKVAKMVPDLIEQRRQEAQNHVTRVMDRVIAVDNELRTEISKSQKEILDEIKQVNNSMSQLRIDMQITTSTIKTDIEKQFNTKIEALEDRLNSINKFIWVITGGAGVVGAVLSQLIGLLHITTG